MLLWGDSACVSGVILGACGRVLGGPRVGLPWGEEGRTARRWPASPSRPRNVWPPSPRLRAAWGVWPPHVRCVLGGQRLLPGFGLWTLGGVHTPPGLGWRVYTTTFGGAAGDSGTTCPWVATLAEFYLAPLWAILLALLLTTKRQDGGSGCGPDARDRGWNPSRFIRGHRRRPGGDAPWARGRGGRPAAW